MRRLLLLASLGWLAPGAEAQPYASPPVALQHKALMVSAAAQTRDPGAFILEAIGGSLGSLAGMGLVSLVSDCGVEDLGCLIKTVGAAGAVGALGATLGVSLVARVTDSRRSFAGAAIGAVVGTALGLGVHYVLNEASDRNLDDIVVIPIFTLSQGTIAAAGSRLLGKRSQRP